MKKTNKKILLNRHNFSIHNFCDKNGQRIELQGIFVSPNHTVATDSFIMIKVDTPQIDSTDYPVIPDKKPLSHFNSFILPQEKAKEVLSIFKKSTALPILENAILLNDKKESIEVGTTDLESFLSITSRKMQGKYPNYNELFIESGKFIEIKVNPKLLKKIIDFYVNFMDSDLDGIKIKIPVDKNSPIRFFSKKKSGQKADAIIMPIKN